MFDKRIIFISASQIDVYQWQNGCLSEPRSFNSGPVGIDELARYVSNMPEILTYLVVDVVEEEFRIELIPHLFGKDKKQYLERRLNQYYRESSYRGTLSLGREQTGRRNDKVLFTALTNPGVFKPWIDCLLENKVPIAGVYTPSVLGGDILQALNMDDEDVLLITQQKNGGIRQSFFHSKQLMLSRLVPVVELDASQYVEFIYSEKKKPRRYLTRLRILDFNNALNVCLVSTSAVVDVIEKNNQNTDLTKLKSYSVVYLEDKIMSVPQGLPKEDTRYCDNLFAHILFSKTPALNYTEPAVKKFKKFRDIRTAMIAASGLFLVTAFLWSGMNVIEGSLLQTYSGEAHASSEYIKQEYEKIIANTPQAPIKASGLMEGVKIAKSLMGHKAMPEKLMQAISAGLNTNIALKIESIDWVVSNDPYTPVVNKNQGKLKKLARAAKKMFSKNSDEIYQIVLITGHLRNFTGNYRKAFDSVNKLASALQEHAEIIVVQAIKYPLDVDSSSSMTGKTGVNVKNNTASFILRAVLKVKQG